MSSLLRTFEGDCHCGALGFSFQTSLPAAEWSVRACQCGFCRAHGARTTSDPCGRLAFRVKRREALQRYRFGRMTEIATARGAFGTINTLALVPQRAGLPAASEANYGAETAGERIARREQRWTPLVKPL